jgi:putative Mg2+ transporter-C (MgtC) family protein
MDTLDGLISWLVAGVVSLGQSLPFDVDVLDMGFRLVCAAIAGALIGWERDRAEKPVDARTMMLVSLGAAAFTLLGERVMVHSVSAGVDSIIRLDPTRVLAYVISGVGFLGAGAILHSKRTVSGLTTASSVWCTAAVGAAFGLGEYAVALLVFLIVFVTLWGAWLFGSKPEPVKYAKGKPNGKSNGRSNGNDKPGDAVDESPKPVVYTPRSDDPSDASSSA